MNYNAKCLILRERYTKTVFARSEATWQPRRELQGNKGSGQMRERQPAVYIVANWRNGTIYTGVTSNLPQRAWQHREGLIDGFARKCGCKRLVWYEMHGAMEAAIAREKQIKAGSRDDKLALIEAMNPFWDDLYERLA
jgi:putative endonuclease